MKFYWLYIILIAYLVAGCASPRKHFKNPDYKLTNNSSKTIIIKPISPSDIKKYPQDHFLDDFNLLLNDWTDSIAADKMNYYFQNFLAKYLDEQVVIATHREKFPFDSEEVSIRGEVLKDKVLNFKYKVPKEVSIKNREANFVLVLTNLVFGFTHNGGFIPAPVLIPGVATGSSPVSHRYFTLKMYYLLYDYSTNQPVIFGRVEATSQADIVVTRSDWMNVMETCIWKIVEESPFKSK